MKLIINVDGTDYYWDESTKQVLRDEIKVYRIIGYADDTNEANEVIEKWLK